MRFTCKTFKRKRSLKTKSKFRANNTRRRRCLFRRKLKTRHPMEGGFFAKAKTPHSNLQLGGGNTLDRSIPLGSVLANPIDWDQKEKVTI